MIFVVDNYDSFTYNLVQALGKLGGAVEVARNDRFEPSAVAAARPGPVTPRCRRAPVARPRRR